MPRVNDAPNARELEQRAGLLRALERNAEELAHVEEDRLDLIAAARHVGIAWDSIAQALGYKSGRYVSEKYKSKI